MWDTKIEKMNACITNIEDPLMENEYCHYSSNKTHLSSPVFTLLHHEGVNNNGVVLLVDKLPLSPLTIQAFQMLSSPDCTVVCSQLDLDLISQSVQICLHLELIHLGRFPVIKNQWW